VLCSLLWVTLLGQGVGLGDPQRALPTPTTLWFCDSVISVLLWAIMCFHPSVTTSGQISNLTHVFNAEQFAGPWTTRKRSSQICPPARPPCTSTSAWLTAAARGWCPSGWNRGGSVSAGTTCTGVKTAWDAWHWRAWPQSSPCPVNGDPSADELGFG